jgi:hypothetical protein
MRMPISENAASKLTARRDVCMAFSPTLDYSAVAMWVLPYLLLPFALVLLSACITENHVAVRAANDLDCPQDKLNVKYIGAGGYRVHGCGESATYVCMGSDGPAAADDDDAVCVREGGN